MMFHNVQNYYEKLVLEELTERGFLTGYEEGYVEDIACVALNNLPTQYFRFEVDMGFYMESEDYLMMRKQVVKAIDDAIIFINDKLEKEN